MGVHWGLYNLHQPERVRATHAELVRLHAEGLIDPLVSRVVTMEQISGALGDLANRGTWGKLVAEPQT